jgi:DNA-binding transcriptional ArsR family regulator
LKRTEYFIPVFSLSLPEEFPLLARALSRTLTMQILKQLQKKQMSAGELASELGLRLNTLSYNLSLLEKAGLIKVIKVRWSCKGREVKIYAPLEQPVLLVPRENKDGVPPVLDTLEKTMELCWKNSPGGEISLPERPEKNDNRIPPDKDTDNQEALPAFTLCCDRPCQGGQWP